MKERTIPNRIPSANRATFPVNDKSKKQGAICSFIPEEQLKESHKETKNKEPKEDRIDVLVKLITGHIKKYDDDTVKNDTRMKTIERNPKNIEENTKNIK